MWKYKGYSSLFPTTIVCKSPSSHWGFYFAHVIEITQLLRKPGDFFCLSDAANAEA